MKTTYLRMLALLSLVMAGSLRLVASNAPEDAWRYTVMLYGTDKLKLEMPCYDADGYDSWIDKGYVYITIEGGNRETLFYYKSDDTGDDDPYVWGNKGVDGDMILERDRNYSTISITNTQTKWVVPRVSGTDYSILHLMWTIPDKYRGKKVTISWSIHKTGNGPIGPAGESSKNITINNTTLEIPAMPPLLYPSVQSPMLGYDAAHAGSMMLVYTMPSNTIQSISAYYTEVNGADELHHTMELDPNVSGYIYLPVDHCYKDFFLESTYEDSEKKVRTTQSTPFDLTMLHNAAGLNVTLQPDGSALLTWTVPDRNWADLMTNDFWEVQRCTSGLPALDGQWVTIGQITYNPSSRQYSVTDENLTTAYEGKPVYYRVRRTCTSLWEWAPNTYAIVRMPLVLHLPTVQTATVGRKAWNQQHHALDFSFTLGGKGLTAQADGLAYDDRGRVVLRSAEDWNTLADSVNAGQTLKWDVVMAADIDLGDSLRMIGTAAHPYQGTFHGNGHTLTFNPKPPTEKDTVAFTQQYAAPFRYVGNATLRDLHVAGSISCSQKFISGLVGNVVNGATLLIERCRSSVMLTSTVKGDATNGGFVANGGSSQQITLRNCLFDGSFEGTECSHNGGLVGWSTGRVKVSRCLFAPSNIATKTDGCENYARINNTQNLTIEYSSLLKSYNGSSTQISMDSNHRDNQGRFVINSSSDWKTFADMVSQAKGAEVNAVLNANITINQVSVGTESAPFHGTFDGNGHEIQALFGGTTDFQAPFMNAKDYTIQNLSVTGSIWGGIHSSGLVGSSNGSSGKRNTIKNCRVSTEVNCSTSHVGGFIGHGGSANHDITNCLFDGELTFFYRGSYAGAIIGWEDGGTSNVITNCLENGKYSYVDHAGMNYKNGGKAYGNTDNSKNNWSYQNWSETNYVDTKTAEEMVKQLDYANWHVRDNAAVPILYKSMLSDQAKTDLLETLGADWELVGGNLMPIMATENDSAYATVLWDDRAKLVLNIEKTTIEDPGSIDKRDTHYNIKNAADWQTFVNKVKAAGGRQSVDAILLADITVAQPVGTADAPYQGDFDGNGHTITLDLDFDKPENYMAPFQYVGGTTSISNLNVKGEVWGSRYTSGLVGCSTDGGTLTIDKCHVSAYIYTYDHVAGGFVGCGNSATNILRNCLFDGGIANNNAIGPSWTGAFIGNITLDGYYKTTVENCLEHGGQYKGFTTSNASILELEENTCESFPGTNNWTYDKKWYNVNTVPAGMTPEELVLKLEKTQWMVDDAGTVVPAQIIAIPDYEEEILYTERYELSKEEIATGHFTQQLTTSCVDHKFNFTVEQGSSPLTPVSTGGVVPARIAADEGFVYAFNNNVQITSLKADTLQTAVTLTWETTGLGDYYRILRYDKMMEKVDTLANMYDQMSYMDRTAQPQHAYIYTIEGVTQCEGLHISRMEITAGCEPTGMVRGYLRLADGTAMAGVTVKATPDKGGLEGAFEKSTVTDEAGFFEIGGLIYQGAATYIISVDITGEMQAMDALSATFDDTKNLVTNLRFTQNNYYRFSGQVIYEGTSVPVVGALFERDGAIVKNGSGQPIQSDSQGNFTISVPQGSHTIRVVKDGHVFANNGFYMNPDDREPTKHNWQKEIPLYVFWDQTHVMLHGRVVGGDDQGDLPLGQSLSRNNLGDSITIVMQLEGDNASYLVRDQLNSSVTELHRRYAVGPVDTCQLDVYRHRLVIYPDVETGEYLVPMLPVKYKVTEVYAQGYATLFQAGEVGQTLDLTKYVDGDTATWNRIYHAAPTLAVKQYNMTGENYFGIKQYNDQDNTGKSYDIELWNDSLSYSFGHPVFMAGSPIMLMLAAEEQYFWNNDNKQYEPDVVHLPGGRVQVENGLVSTTETKEIQLDSLGEAVYSFIPQNLTFTEEGDMALKTLTISMEYDSTFYDIKPLGGKALSGYVLASKPKEQGRRIVSDGGICLIDILRDPPGSGSSAYIESGTKLNYSFTQNVKTQAGVNLSFNKGGGSDWYNGVWAGVGGGQEVGQINSSSSTNLFTMPFVATYYNSWQYNYTFETTERISTATGQMAVGRDADVFIGMTRNAVVEDAIAVRVIADSTYQMLKTHEGGTFSEAGINFNVRQGTMKALAQGKDSKGEKVWLVRDEVLQVSTHINSTFVHSQSHIEQELIPNLIKTRNSLLLSVGTDSVTAQAVADNQGFPAYISSVPEDDENFAQVGYYKQINPTDKNASQNDSIQTLNRNIWTWISFLAVNEREKVEASNLVKSYDVDGRSSVNYSEAFTLAESESRYFLFPLITGFNFSSGSFNVKNPKPSTHTEQATGDPYGMEIDIKTFGTSISIKMNVVASVDYNYNYGKSETATKKVGFTLAPSTKSYMTVDVYRTQNNQQLMDERRAALLDAGYKENDVNQMLFMYASEDFVKNIKLGENKVPGTLGGMCSYMTSTPQMYRSLVYRTRGGATCAPYEDERLTKYYNAGTLLDAKTIEIDRLRIWADEQTVSNVPYDEPARFTIHMANESEAPALATEVFSYFLNDPSNAKGAKLQIEGVPLSGTGSAVYIPAGSVVTKQVEFYPGAEFDYENVGISLFDSNDKKRIQTVYLSAHFVPTAGKVNISLPGDKWVINTESQFDTRLQQYYMPVVIDGFNVNYRGFDHIELQYKLSNQGDKEWVNVCSFYSDSLLMAKASGVCQMIEDDGRIVANFYGEIDPIEQQYDLRAVNYCRHGGGYLTRSSEILTGIKDTRRPQLFGTPKPEDGILDIGDDIMLRFSEQIAGNYLRPLNNFQVLGQTNSSNIALSTDLRFNGNGFAVSKGSRNLAGKSFTVDVMLKPDNNGQPMTFMTHGQGSQQLELSLTADRRLTAFITMEDTTGSVSKEYTSTAPIDFDGLHRVQITFQNNQDSQTTGISFYDGTKQIGQFTHPACYEGFGPLVLGGNQPYFGRGYKAPNYEGEMLEFRLWGRVLSQSEMSDYSMKRLTGYELGLLDNYPLNEGNGDYCYNTVESGSDLTLTGASWKVPDGIGMKLDGQQGFRLAPDKFQRWSHQDYTLMFWFRTSDLEGTLLANGRAEDEAEASEHFNFGVKGGSLDLHLGGLDIPTSTYVSDGQWHHTALTVCRSRNVGCLYVDNELRSTFAVDTLGGIKGNQLAAGATYESGSIKTPITGHIDEIAMFEMALPENSIKAFSRITPTGEEMGLMAYLNFSQNELQTDNQQRLMPTGVSLKRYKDKTTGQLTAQRDTIVAQDMVDRLADRTLYAPMRGTQSLENIKYSFVADSKDLLINLDVPDERIEKTHVYIVVRDVADMQGNLLASPVAMDLYVYRNPLRWNKKTLSLSTVYGEETTFEATIQNLSGKARRYSLEGPPVWMTASRTSGSVGALGEETITFTISPYINIGNFDEVISLVGEDGMNEPLPINIKVRREAPDWAVDQSLLQGNLTMNVIANVNIGGVIMNDPEDRLAVFGEDHRTLGVAGLDADPNNAEGGVAYLTIFGSSAEETPLRYEFYDASTGVIHVLLSSPEVSTFRLGSIVGTPDEPYQFEANNGVVQTIQLQDGWNWISLNVEPVRLPIGQLLGRATKWAVGDGLEIIKADGTSAQISYKQLYNADDPKNPILAWDEADKVVKIDPEQMFRFYSHGDKTAYISGFPIYDVLTVHSGWNRISYLAQLNLPVGTALADYTDKASAGDIIKSQSEFAVLSVDGDGNKSWKGTLKYMKVGEGYMLKRNAAGSASFTYPIYFGASRYNGGSSLARARYVNRSGTSMTMVAKAKGVDAAEGDVLTAWRGAEVCGVAVADTEGVFYLNIGDAKAATSELIFTLEHDDKVVATTSSHQMSYQPDAAFGTPDDPTSIDFVTSDELTADGWYTLSGIKLAKRPTTTGVYIHNNEKVIIK
ncbi:MAG: hypothetical protein IJV06_08880 [Bacteroidaceae bacterium]|nr:hypothetical protein [Bacteroidaceae bacterium]